MRRPLEEQGAGRLPEMHVLMAVQMRRRTPDELNEYSDLEVDFCAYRGGVPVIDDSIRKLPAAGPIAPLPKVEMESNV
jgi:hypothetical protein